MRKLSVLGLLLISFSALGAMVPSTSATVNAAPTDCRASGGNWNDAIDGGVCICPEPEGRFNTQNCYTSEYLCEDSGGDWGQEYRTDTSPPGLVGRCSCPAGSTIGADGRCLSNCERSGGDLNGSACSCPAGYETRGSGASASCRLISSSPSGGLDDCGRRESFLGITTWYRGLPCTDSISADDIFAEDETNPVVIIILNIMSAVARLAGVITVVFVIVGGFKFVLSDGSPDKAAEARKTIINALVGAVIVAVAGTVVEIIYRIIK